MLIRKIIRHLSTCIAMSAITFLTIDLAFNTFAASYRGAGLYIAAQIAGQLAWGYLIMSKKVILY